MAKKQQLQTSGPIIPPQKTSKLPGWKTVPGHAGNAIIHKNGKITQRLSP